MKNKIRLVVVEPNNSGGLVHFAYQMCNALAEEGLDVTMLAGTKYDMEYQPHNFRVKKMMRLWEKFDPSSMRIDQVNPIKNYWRRIYWNVRRLLRGIRLVLAWIRLTLYLLKTRPDIIQFTRIEFSFETIFIHYLHQRGFIMSQVCHEFENRETTKQFAAFIERLNGNIYLNFAVIFFLSDEVRAQFFNAYPSIPKRNTCVIPHGNSGWLLNVAATPENTLRERYALGDSERIVLFFGLLSPSKGLDDLLDAFAIVCASSDAKLVIAGYPTKHINMNELAERVSKLGITSRVIFDPRYIPDEEIPSLMRLASVVIYPYRSGTQSGALQTAYTFGRPVIVTDVGGLPEVVEDGKSGFIVPPQNPPALAKKIILLVNDSALAEEMGTYARHLSETKYSWSAVAQQMRAVYKQALITHHNS